MRVAREHIDNEELTPIHLAARKANGSLVKAFHACGANIILARNRQGCTAMHHTMSMLNMLSKDSLTEAFGDFLTPREGNEVDDPELDGWTPIHWACKRSKDGVIEMLLSRYKHPIQALRCEGTHGWRPIVIALFYRNDDAVNVIERCIMAMDTDRTNPQPASDEEAFQAGDAGDDASVPPSWPPRSGN